MNSSSSGELDAFGRARYKLQQAELALAYLRQVPAEIAVEMRRARSLTNPDLRLDTFFFSCLGLAQSAFYILDAEHRSKALIRSWKINALDQDGRTRFNKMMDIRGMDVHHGKSEGLALATMIPLERSYDGDNYIYQQQTNTAALGISRQATEHRNPDGSTVSSYEGLQGSMNLYIEIAGNTYEGAAACEWFIAQLKSLIDTVSAAGPTPPAPLPGT